MFLPTNILFYLIIGIGVYFLYFRPQLNMFTKLKDDKEFSNHMLIIESNSEFNKTAFEKAKKHMKLFFIYYSNSLNHDNHSAFIPKLEKQHVKTMHYLNKILNSTPQSMKRYSYMTNSISYLNNNMQKYINKKSENTKSF